MKQLFHLRFLVCEMIMMNSAQSASLLGYLSPRIQSALRK